MLYTAAAALRSSTASPDTNSSSLSCSSRHCDVLPVLLMIFESLGLEPGVHRLAHCYCQSLEP
jgi:hypothetical protein